MQPGEAPFTARSVTNMVADLNRNRKMSPGHTPLQELLNNKGSASPNMDKQTGLPIAGKYLNGQEQNAAPAPGVLPEEEEQEEQLGRRQEGPQGSVIQRPGPEQG